MTSPQLRTWRVNPTNHSAPIIFRAMHVIITRPMTCCEYTKTPEVYRRGQYGEVAELSESGRNGLPKIAKYFGITDLTEQWYVAESVPVGAASLQMHMMADNAHTWENSKIFVFSLSFICNDL